MTTTYDPSAITISRIGGFVEIIIGKSVVRMTTEEAEHMVRAIEQAIDPPLQQKRLERIH